MIELHGLLTLLSFAAFWGLFAAVGLVIARLFLLPDTAFGNEALASRWRQMLGECTGLLALIAVVVLVARTAEMDDGSLLDILADLPSVLTRTHFGLVWCIQLAALAAFWLAFARARVQALSRPRQWAGFGCLALLAFTYSATSHAADGGDFTLAEFNDWAHVLVTSMWGGAIFACALLVFPAVRADGALALQVAIRLSNLAALVLPLVLLTGMYNTRLRLPDWNAFVDTNYGRILGIKLCVVCLVAGIGAFNRFVAIPRARRLAGSQRSGFADPLRLLFPALVTDAALVVLAIIVAAYLAQSEPAKTTAALAPHMAGTSLA